MACGIKKDGQKDLALIYSEFPAVAAGVFTRNKIVSPSAAFSRRNIRKGGTFRAVLANSGNANACVGPGGMDDCRAIARALGKALDISAGEILLASTGVIGVPLPRDKIVDAIPALTKSLSPTSWNRAARAILTTDLVSKTAQTRLSLGGREVVIGGIAKGSGMIHPNMATMLAFIQTNVDIEAEALQAALKQATDQSFNRITVDGDCSTNDSVMCLANGQAGNGPLQPDSPDYTLFAEALTEVCQNLARKIVKDGEGATKFITVRVQEAKSANAARKVAFSVATSNLVKTAIFGEDPNWGRIICAVGNAGVSLRPDRIDISLNGVSLVKNGAPNPRLPLEALRKKMKRKSIVIEIGLNSGGQSAEVYTCDLSYDYVKINAEYTT